MRKTLRARHLATPFGWKLALLTGLGIVGALSATDAAAQTCNLTGKPSPASCYSTNPADWPAPERPYFMVVFDVSGSMVTCTNPAPPQGTPLVNSQCASGATPNSCGLVPSRINDGKCALRKMVQAFSEVDFGLVRFNQTITNCSATSTLCTQYVVDGTMPETANLCSVTAACDMSGTGASAKGGQVLVGLPVGSTTLSSIIQWTDDNCQAPVPTNTIGPELLPAGPTPINGALRDAGRHLRTNAANLAPSCRPVNVILITDGAETCDGTVTDNRAAAAAQDLYMNGLSDGSGRHVKVYPIGFGGLLAAETTALNAIASFGQCGAATCTPAVTALVANNEAELSQKLSAIISAAVAPEECDNVDNNCNGCVDEGYLHYCNTNTACCVWANQTERTNLCLNKFKTTLNPADLPCTTVLQSGDCSTWLCYDPKDSCGNGDNNCNSTIDEGAIKCNGHCPQIEICNNQDDDCDGVIDDKTTDGVAYSGCIQCVKSVEICDGCDNDCDGIADNNIAPLACGIPTPPNCAGTRSCKPAMSAGTPNGCLAGGPSDSLFWGNCITAPANEICDGIDNDCDGTIDDGVPATKCEIPGQAGLKYQDDGFATSQCKKGLLPCNGICSGWVGPSQELCDGIDNDCDGLVDKQDPDIQGIGIVCGSANGTCTKGVSDCVNGQPVCVGGKLPQPEICDNLDNDCNGAVDDGQMLDAPPANEKPCWNLPPSGCNPPCAFGGFQWCPPAGATCHDVGTLAKPPCELGLLTCNAGTWQCAGGLAPETESCDGVDNNCDGTIDNIPQDVCFKTVPNSPCVAGVWECLNGKINCKGGHGAEQEICNNYDDDCDGVIDNGIFLGTTCWDEGDPAQYPPPQGGNRQHPECKPGVQVCGTNGQPACEGAIGPKPEVCDGLDNDCDTQTDEEGPAPDGLNGSKNPKNEAEIIGEACGTNVPNSPCVAGIYRCEKGDVICTATKPKVEVCDCVDNDCDGKTDEDPSPGEPPICGADQVCVKYQGGCQCAPKCKTGEFPCPTGTKCESVNKSVDDLTAGQRCVSVPCGGGDCSKDTVSSSGKVECAPSTYVVDAGLPPPVCVCKGQNGCHAPCFQVSCDPPSVCTNYGANAGKCVADNCYNVPCQPGEACHSTGCIANPCATKGCAADKVCRPSADFTTATCEDSCAGVTPPCSNTEVCKAGKCVATGCATPCPTGKVCAPGADGGSATCIDNQCTPTSCPNGAYCNPVTGACGDYPCSGVVCPSKQQCVDGQCVASVADAGTDADTGAGGAAGSAGQAGAAGSTPGQDGGPAADDKGRFGLATGGGGCACKVGSGPRNTGAGIGLLLIGLAMTALRRRARTTAGASNRNSKLGGGSK
jgi:hypothetical protein